MDIQFIELSENVDSFFKILPTDWKSIIQPHWIQYKTSSTVYAIKENDEIIAGGIVFTNKFPGITEFEQQFLNLIEDNYYYLGFLWVAEHKRNKNLATFWLDTIKKTYPNQKFWLTIEEEKLKYFYEKNGFKIISESKNLDYKEWILTFK